MRNDNDRIFKIDQKLFEPANRIEIQVVGRLVEEKNVRIAEQSTCQKHFDFFTSGKFAHFFVMKFGVNIQSVQKSSSIGLSFPSVHGSKFAFQFAGTDSVFLGKIFFCVNGIFFFHDVIKTLVSHDDSVKDNAVIVFEVILFQHGKALTGGDADIALCRLQFSGKNLQKGRFSGTVGTDDTIAVSFGKFYIYFFKERLFSKAQCNVICLNHNFLHFKSLSNYLLY